MLYLDHAATTSMFPEVLEAMLPWMRPDHVGNPGSIHTQGVKAKKAIETAREQVAAMLNAHPTEIFFTSGGTESINTWAQCLVSPVVATTFVEHDSVLLSPTYRYMLPVRPDGSVQMDALRSWLAKENKHERAVSLMWVNNELGTVNPVEEIGEICHEHNVFFHTDAVQAAGHVPIDVKKCHVDALSLSAHKFGGPLGVGVLYLASHVWKSPLIFGGGQERGMRGGTENVPGIVGLGKAAQIVTERLDLWIGKFRTLRQEFFENLNRFFPEKWLVNGGSESSNIISLTIPGVNSEALLLLLDQRGVCLSAGSACSAASGTASHVLHGIGLTDEAAASTVRISMGYDTTSEDMSFAAHELADCSRTLLGMYPDGLLSAQ